MKIVAFECFGTVGIGALEIFKHILNIRSRSPIESKVELFCGCDFWEAASEGCNIPPLKNININS